MFRTTGLRSLRSRVATTMASGMVAALLLASPVQSQGSGQTSDGSSDCYPLSANGCVDENRPPVIEAPSVINVVYGEGTGIKASASDPDSDDVTHFSLATNPTVWGIGWSNKSQLPSGAPEGTISIPKTTRPGSYKVWIHAIDEHGAKSTHTVVLNVNSRPGNKLPSIDVPSEFVGYENSYSWFKIVGSDSDGHIVWTEVTFDRPVEGMEFVRDTVHIDHRVKAGTYIVTSMVHDNDGGVATKTTRVVIKPPRKKKRSCKDDPNTSCK